MTRWQAKSMSPGRPAGGSPQALPQLAWFITGAICCFLGYLFIWQRGLFMDDYGLHAKFGVGSVLEAADERGRLPARFLAFASAYYASGLTPQYEYLVRLIAAFGSGINALLLARLVYQLQGSRLTALVSGWLFLMPFYAQQAVLWSSASGRILGAAFSLLTLLAVVQAFATEVKSWHWMFLGTLAFSLVLLTTETYVLVLCFLPLLALVFVIRHHSWRALKLALLGSTVLGFISLSFYMLFYRGQAVLSQRGTMDLHVPRIVERCQSFLERAYWMTIGESWGAPLMAESIRLGWRTVLESSKGLVLLVAAVVCIAVTICTWRPSDTRSSENRRVSVLLCGIGFFWMLSTLLLPGALLVGPILSYRMLHFPAVGAILVVAGVVGTIASSVRRSALFERGVIGAAGLVLLASTVSMLGFSRAFAARHELDRQQIASVVHRVPSEVLPEGTVFVPYRNEEKLFEGYDRLNKFITPVFGTRWSAESALNLAYGRKDLRVVAENRWLRTRIEYSCQETEPQPDVIRIRGSWLPLDRALVLRYSEGAVTLIEELTADTPEPDDEQCLVKFPLAKELSKRGVPTVADR